MKSFGLPDPASFLTTSAQAPVTEFDSMMSELGSPYAGLGTDALLKDLQEAQNRSGMLAEELVQLHKEAATAEKDLPVAAHLEDRLQDLVAAEREEAQRDERLAINLAGWLSATKAMMNEQT